MLQYMLHPKLNLRLAELGDRTMGCRTSASPVIRSVRHHEHSVHPSIPDFHSPYVSCFRSSFCFMFLFLFTFSVLIRIFRSYLHFPFLFAFSVLIRIFHSYSHFPFHSIFDPQARNLTLTYARFSLPWHVLFDTYTFRSSCMFLSLKLTLIVPRTHCPNLRTLVCLSPEIRGQ